MGRTLYLSENSSGMVVLRDGPSVWIKSRENAGQRIPVRLISRAVVIGNVRLDAAVITLFTENDIPVIFMNQNANEIATAIPFNNTIYTRYKEQDFLLRNRDKSSSFKKWAEAKKMAIQADVVKRLYRPATFHINDSDYAEIISFLKPRDENQWIVVKGFINNLFKELATAELLRARLDPHLGIIHNRQSFGLVHDICHIMEAENDIQCLQFFKCSRIDPFIEKQAEKYRISSAGIKSIIHRFENRLFAVHAIVKNIVDKLHDLIRELRI